MSKRHCNFIRLLSLISSALAFMTASGAAPILEPEQTIRADVVALDQPFMFNRLGAAQPQGMIFALQRDVVAIDPSQGISAGNVMLRRGKRARPMVLRVNVGQYLEIHFSNLLSTNQTNGLEPGTRNASVHVTGMELVDARDSQGKPQPGIDSDATRVGANENSLAMPGETKIYRYYAKAEGTFLLYSAAGDWAGQLQSGLFGAVNVEPKDAEWYRSQVTHEDLHLAAYFAGKVGNLDKVALPGHPKMTLSRQRDPDSKPVVVEVDGESLQAWTLTTVEPAQQTVHTAPVVIIDDRLFTLDGRPLVDYNAVYPKNHPRAGTPILKMLLQNKGVLELVHSDLTAIITGPNSGRFPYNDVSPGFNQNPALPDRRQPFREFTIHYHEVLGAVQAFSQFYDPPLADVLGAGVDAFAINYGTAGIGAEVLANRLGVGPMGNKDAVDLKFEEFFLSSWAVGDPAMVVDVPANVPNQVVSDPEHNSKVINEPIVNAVVNGSVPPFSSLERAKATKAFYPDDPSNVYHSYMRDHVKIRLLHAGGGITHIHHLHAHQWLHSPDSDNSHYLDSQMINPGATYTLEMVYNGSGNRNQTVGDSIFHCHFYPHFAGGMWGLWRVHDVFEGGTLLDRAGRPVSGLNLAGHPIWNRALPDGEIAAGTPIPAFVPLPTLPMAPVPARVQLTHDGRRAIVMPETGPSGEKVYKSPGYPFFIPAVAGHRAPHPPLDFAWEEEETGKAKLDAHYKKIYLNGGLPRHLVLDGKIVREFHTRWDFSKDFVIRNKEGKAIDGGLVAFELPEEGTEVEKAAMAAHSQRTHPSYQPNGDPGNFILNGLPPAPGAPYANPSVDDNGNAEVNTRRYQAAAVQMDVVFNKKGWHFPQQRFITLWEDVKPTVSGERPPQPFFFRANTGETIEFWHSNLVPDYYELDDFQIRTPTDVLGQHIHLVKFDVTSSDGAANGFNYEDGTLSPDEVRNRIDALNLMGGLFEFDAVTQFKGAKQKTLRAKPALAVFGTPPANQNWLGAQTTIQRWDTDPLLNNQGEDRTMRTVFTHDHFGPSTHQQVGLYGGLLIEPEGSKWYDPVSGELFYNTTNRHDGGPTSWQANIVTANQAGSYREFTLEFGDFQLAYTKESPSTNTTPASPLFSAPAPQWPTGTNQVPRSLRDVFSQNGITLSEAAFFTKEKDNGWVIADPRTPDERERYQVKQNGGNVQVFALKLNPGWSSPQFAINPPPPDLANQLNGPPYPTLISAIGPPAPGTYSLNYRNEPLPSRVWDPTHNAPPAGKQGDLSHVFSSIQRADSDLNQQPTPGTAINSANPGGFKFPANLVPTADGPQTNQDPASGKAQPYDPFTPLLRAYASDKVQIRTLVGAQHDPHYFNIQGVKWFFEPEYANSGYRNDQVMGISEHLEMLFDLPPATTTAERPFADYLYLASSGTDGLNNGLWGLMRAYDRKVDGLLPLPNNPPSPTNLEIKPPSGVTPRRFNIVATTAAQALPGHSLIYNSRGQVTNANPSLAFDKTKLIEDPYALIYVRGEDLDADGKLKANVPVEPLILRAGAGEWIEITLSNAFNAEPTFTFTNGVAALPPFGSGPLAAINLLTSKEVGLHPQLVSYDMNKANGVNVGFNPPVTVERGKTSEPIYWYAGNLSIKDGKLEATPIELGAINLVPSDPLQQHPKGLAGALIIEPQGSAWQEDTNSRASATVTKSDGSKFREFVVVIQDDVTLYSGTNTNGNPAPYGASPLSINYRIEPMAYRYPTNGIPGDVSEAMSDQLVQADPQTPVFVASAGSPVRFRMLHPTGGPGSDGQVITLDGHVWQEEPYVNGSREIGHNPLSQWFGSRGNFGARNHFEIVLDSAGGSHKVPGDYLYRSLICLIGGGDVEAGFWGIFRVSQPGKDAVVITKAEIIGQQLHVEGINTVNPDSATPDTGAKFAQNVQLFADSISPNTRFGSSVPVDQNTGAWKFQGSVPSPKPAKVWAQSSDGGTGSFRLAPPAAERVAAVRSVKKASESRTIQRFKNR